MGKKLIAWLLAAAMLVAPVQEAFAATIESDPEEKIVTETEEEAAESQISAPVILSDTAAVTETQDLALTYGSTGTLAGPDGLSYVKSKFKATTTDGVITVDSSGNYTVIGTGSTTVTGTFYDAAGDKAAVITYNITVAADMTEVAIAEPSQTKYILKTWGYTGFIFTLTPGSVPLPKKASDYTFKFKSLNSDITMTGQMLDGGQFVLRPQSSGTAEVKVTINKTVFYVTVKAVYYGLNKDTLLLSKSKTSQLKVSGLKGDVVWSSSNKKVAKVSSTGKVTAVKTGNAVIKAVVTSESGTYTVGCAVSVATAKKYKAVKTAIRISSNGTYSQPKRMLKGYYDCSSLVWRAYKSVGVYMVWKSGNAPVAASIAYWYVNKKKMISGGMSEKNVSNMTLKAGDLMFEDGANNGRYKGIYHVEMIAGYCCKGFDDNGDPILGTTWANRTEDYYKHIGQMVARP